MQKAFKNSICTCILKHLLGISNVKLTTGFESQIQRPNVRVVMWFQSRISTWRLGFDSPLGLTTEKNDKNYNHQKSVPCMSSGESALEE